MVPSSFSSSTFHINLSFLLQQYGIKSTISWRDDDDCRAFDKPFNSHHLPQSSNSREKRRFVSIAKLVEVRIPRSRWDDGIINNHEVTSLSSVHPRPSDSPCSQEEDGPTGRCSVGGQVTHRWALLSPKSHMGGSCRQYRIGCCRSSILLLPCRTTCSVWGWNISCSGRWWYGNGFWWMAGTWGAPIAMRFLRRVNATERWLADTR